MRQGVSDSLGLLNQLSRINMDDMRQVVENLRKYNKHIVTTGPAVVAEVNKHLTTVAKSPEAMRELEEIRKQLNDISLEVKKVQAQETQGKIPLRMPRLTALQGAVMQELDSMFPDLGKLNFPTGNKETLEFARRLDADINRQVEMGEPAAKPYDCR
jgi:glutamyl-tRNA reductase